MFNFSLGGNGMLRPTWPKAGVLYQCTECYLENWCLRPDQPQTLHALNLDKLRLFPQFLGALLEPEVKFPVLRGMLIMAMLSIGKELNGGLFSSTLARSAGTRARDVIQPTWGLALVLACELM